MLQPHLTIYVFIDSEIFPNPSNQNIHWEKKIGNGNYSIINNLGQVVKNGTLNDVFLDITSLTAGHYTMTINSADNKYKASFIKI